MINTTLLARRPASLTPPQRQWKPKTKSKPATKPNPVPKATWESWMRNEATARQIKNKQGPRTVLSGDDTATILKRTLGGD